MFQYHNVWFINFNGIGNGVVIAPILRCFEKSQPLVNYYHTENQLLADSYFVKEAGLKNLKGFSPATWRRFKKKDWKAIELFVKERDIDLIVNLRNEGPQYDIDYYKFKKNALKKKTCLDFWDFDFDIIEQRTIRQNLTGDILALFQKHSIDVSCYNPKWLESIRRNGNQYNNIGFGMAASQTNKRWPIAKWTELANIILANSKQSITLFPGKSEEEMKEATRVFEQIGKRRCEIVRRQTLKNIALQISELHCFVSNDTGLLHIAAAVNIPTIGLYISTDSKIWSPCGKENFAAFQNVFIEKCSDTKPHCGNCFHYYNACPMIKKYGDSISPNEVYAEIATMIDGD